MPGMDKRRLITWIWTVDGIKISVRGSGRVWFHAKGRPIYGKADSREWRAFRSTMGVAIAEEATRIAKEYARVAP